MSLSLSSRIRLINRLACITLLINLILFVILYTSSINNGVFVPACSFILALIALFLNFKKYYFLNQLVGCFLFPICIFATIIEEGAILGEFNVFPLCVILSFIVLEDRPVYKYGAIIWITLLAVVSFDYIKHNFDENTIGTHQLGSTIIFITVIIVLCVFISFYQRGLKHQRQLKEALLADLEASNKTLRNSNEDLERFAYIASHDLKQPLNTISSFARLLQREGLIQDSEKLSTYTQYIASSSLRMKNLIEDILEYSKVNQEGAAPKEIDTHQMVLDIQHIIVEQIKTKNAQIQIQGQLPTILAQEHRIFVVFKNLIENGLKYNESEVPIIHVSHQLIGDSIKFAFRDNGIGIDPQYFPKLFVMFSRLESNTKYEGTGLGLSLCRRIIENMDGRMYVDSEVGKGSTFFFEIPKSYLVEPSSVQSY